MTSTPESESFAGTMNAHKLPVVPTTQFCEARVDVGLGLVFWVDGNSKITRENGTYAAPTPNAFSLPAASVSGGEHCPGSTAVCRESCYVRGLAKNVPRVYALYMSNAAALQEALAGGMGEHVAFPFAQWIRANAPHGFRWHVSGDVWDREHADWIALVCCYAPEVPFWIYTRTLDAVMRLRPARNLAVNISADSENYEAARACAIANGARLAYMATEEGHVPADLPAGSIIFPDYALRGRALDVPTSAPWWQTLTHDQRAMVCPADFFGQSEAHRCGPCAKCLT